MAEVIIVGSGLAAACLMHRFHANSIPFRVITQPNLSNSSRVAAGVWNPVVFKRLTKSWMADRLLPETLTFYKAIELQSGKKFLFERRIIRPLTNQQEQDAWTAKAKNELDDFLEDKIEHSNAELFGLKMQGSYGLVNSAGNLDIGCFLDYTMRYFSEKITEETFDYSLVETDGGKVRYKQHNYAAIVFCEGWLIKNNPFFNWIPMKPAKGEVLTLKAEGFDLKNYISNRSTFLFQQHDGNLRCGASYEWEHLNEVPTEAAKTMLLNGYAEHSNKHVEVIQHLAGVRPATTDRRPVLGEHPLHKGLFVFNGLGSKGVMLAPYFSKKFVNFYLQQEELSAEVSIRRFNNAYEQSTTS